MKYLFRFLSGVFFAGGVHYIVLLIILSQIHLMQNGTDINFVAREGLKFITFSMLGFGISFLCWDLYEIFTKEEK